jgi:hypothetical protein
MPSTAYGKPPGDGWEDPFKDPLGALKTLASFATVAFLIFRYGGK